MSEQWTFHACKVNVSKPVHQVWFYRLHKMRTYCCTTIRDFSYYIVAKRSPDKHSLLELYEVGLDQYIGQNKRPLRWSRVGRWSGLPCSALTWIEQLNTWAVWCYSCLLQLRYCYFVLYTVCTAYAHWWNLWTEFTIYNKFVTIKVRLKLNKVH